MLKKKAKKFCLLTFCISVFGPNLRSSPHFTIQLSLAFCDLSLGLTNICWAVNYIIIITGIIILPIIVINTVIGVIIISLGLSWVVNYILIIVVMVIIANIILNS